MPNFSKIKNYLTPNKILGITNLLTFVVVCADLATNPKAATDEYLLDLISHALQSANCFLGNKSSALAIIAPVSDLLRLNSIALHAYKGDSSISLLNNAADVLNHSINLAGNSYGFFNNKINQSLTELLDNSLRTRTPRIHQS